VVIIFAALGVIFATMLVLFIYAMLILYNILQWENQVVSSITGQHLGTTEHELIMLTLHHNDTKQTHSVQRRDLYVQKVLHVWFSITYWEGKCLV